MECRCFGSNNPFNVMERLMRKITAAVVVCLFLSTAALAEELPRVLIIGDSISNGYTPHVKAMLDGKAIVTHNRGNAGDTWRGMANIDSYLAAGEYDVIHFNWGLWDLCWRNPKSKVQGNRDKVDGTLTSTLEQYEANLDKLTARLKKSGAKLIWASTTVVPEGEAGRILGDDLKYNAVAARVMKKYDVPTNDLNAVSRTFDAELFVGPGNVHFTKEGSKKLAEQTVEEILEVLK